MIAVRPPEYWPRPAFFALADAAGRMILADTFQYSRQSYQNRARLRTPQGRQWISIPLKGGQHGRPIRKVEIEGKPGWMRAHWRAFQYNYRTAPFFGYYEAHLREIFEQEWKLLADLTCATTRAIAALLDLRIDFERASEVASGADTLGDILTAAGDRELITLQESVEHDRGTASSMQVLAFDEPRYHQNFEGFSPGTSVVDILFNYGPETLAILRRSAEVRPVPPAMR